MVKRGKAESGTAIRLVIVVALVAGLSACGRIDVDAGGSGSNVEYWSIGIRF